MAVTISKKPIGASGEQGFVVKAFSSLVLTGEPVITIIWHKDSYEGSAADNAAMLTAADLATVLAAAYDSVA